MKELVFKTSQGEYKAFIGNDLFVKNEFNPIGGYISDKKVLVIYDENVPFAFVDNIKSALYRDGNDVFLHKFPSGEDNKNIDNLLSIASFAFGCGITRGDCIIAAGGGVTSDMAGFLASVYMRGIDYYCIPTTLLSAVDACAGGKNGVDLPFGKNLLGTFYNPKAIFCDVSAFASLPEKEIKNALGECVKYSLISNGELWNYICELAEKFRINKAFSFLLNDVYGAQNLVFNCLSIKKNVVEADEFDRGERIVLNLGHTVGHAIEALSDYKLSHGECVAIGIVEELKASAKMGITSSDLADKVASIFEAFGIETKNPFLLSDELAFIARDKKRKGNKILIPVIVSPSVYKILSLDYNEFEEYLCR